MNSTQGSPARRLNRTYLAGVIGCGRIGADSTEDGSSRIDCHAQAYTSSSRVRLVAASDLNENRLAKAGARWGIDRLYTNYHEMLDREKLDLVSICTPTETHVEVLGSLLEHGRTAGILMEKPTAATLKDAVHLAKRAASSPTTVSVNYGRRFCPAYQQVAREIQQGRLGRLQFIYGVYTKGLYRNGTHLLDLLRWFYGNPMEVMATEGDENEPDPTLSLRLTWPDGASGWIQSADHEAFNLFELDLVHTEGRLRFVDQGHHLERYGVEDVASTYGFRQLTTIPTIEATGFQYSIRYAVEDLIESMENGRVPACTLDDGKEAVGLAERALHGLLPQPMGKKAGE